MALLIENARTALRITHNAIARLEVIVHAWHVAMRQHSSHTLGHPGNVVLAVHHVFEHQFLVVKPAA